MYYNERAGEGSIFDDKGEDMLFASLGNGKRMQISKQTAEVAKWMMHPLQSAYHKSSTPVKLITESDSIGEFFSGALSASAPIGVKQAISQNTVAGILGVPISNDYKR